jgi:hypothetical protein
LNAQKIADGYCTNCTKLLVSALSAKGGSPLNPALTALSPYRGSAVLVQGGCGGLDSARSLACETHLGGCRIGDWLAQRLCSAPFRRVRAAHRWPPDPATTGDKTATDSNKANRTKGLHRPIRAVPGPCRTVSPCRAATRGPPGGGTGARTRAHPLLELRNKINPL